MNYLITNKIPYWCKLHRCQATINTLNFMIPGFTKATLKLQVVHSGQTPNPKPGKQMPVNQLIPPAKWLTLRLLAGRTTAACGLFKSFLFWE